MNNNAHQMHDKRKRINSRYEMGVSWRLFGALLIFVAVMLIVIWVFQVALLNWFYEQSKMEELETTDKALSAFLTNPQELNNTASFYAAEYDECIRVFIVENGDAREIVKNICTSPACLIHHVSGETLSDYCTKAMKSEDGVYIEQHAHSDSHSKPNTGDFGTVYVSVRESDGSTYVIMLNSDHLPLNATVNTLQMQFSWIAFILLVAALIVALSIS